MLYRTKNGRIIDENELNQLSPMEVEDYGIHTIDHWNFWREEA